MSTNLSDRKPINKSTVNSLDKSLLTVFMALKFMDFVRFLFGFSLYKYMYSTTKLFDAIPVVGWIFFLNKFGFKVFGSIYGYCDKIETNHEELKQIQKTKKKLDVSLNVLTLDMSSD